MNLLQQDRRGAGRVSRAIELRRFTVRGLNLLRAVGQNPIKESPSYVVHRENKWRLLRYRRHDRAGFQTPVLLVPSLINRHYVLDLSPGRSFVEFLLDQGHEVFMLDWGRPGSEDRYLSFDDITEHYLGRAMQRVGTYSPDKRVHVLGYCLGGTLAAIHAAAHPGRFASLVALAAPVHFAVEGMLNEWMRLKSFNVHALVDGTGNVPWPLMQLAFHLLRPTLSLAKTAHLVDRAWDDEFLDGFFAIEAWGNDNVSFPGEAYRTYVEELYRGDAFFRGVFDLDGKRVSLSDIDCALKVISFEHDTIVPGPSAAALYEHSSSSDKHHLHLPGGHVGAVVSRKASTTLWPEISNWWAERAATKPVAKRRPRAVRSNGATRRR